MSKKKTTFNVQWLEEEKFKSWLIKNGEKARCRLCRKDIELSNMGRQALISHCSGKKHKEHDVKVKSFFQPVRKSVDNPEDKTSTTSGPSSQKTQATLELVVTNSEKTKADILWALKSITAGYSNNSCSDNSSLFQNMFPDSKIAKSFQLGPNKLKYITNFGIAPYFKSLLIESLKESVCYVISFDESLNEMTQSCEMDLMIRYFDEKNRKVKVRFYDSQFFGHGTSKDIQKQFNDALKDLNPIKLFQVGMDGPNVNLKFLRLIQQDREENEQHQLIDIGSCGLHTIHNAFKIGTEKTGWGMKKILKAAFQIFHDSPARREDFFNVTGSNQFPLSFCSTRWIEDKRVAVRLLELWPNIVKMVNHWESLQKSKRPSSKSYSNLLSAVNDNLTPAKLHFFSFVAGMFEPFLVKYQSDKPMIPFLHDDLLKLVKRVMLLVLKPNVVHQCTTVTELKKVDLTNKTFFLQAKDINLGFGTRQCIADLKKSDLVLTRDHAAFLNECISFITVIVSKLFDRSPLMSVIVRNANALNPNEIADKEVELLRQKMNKILTHFMKLKIMSPTNCDEALEQYVQFLEEIRRIHLEDLKLFNPSKSNLDDFYFSQLDINIRQHTKFQFVLKVILTLSHGQAAVERGFSLAKSSLQVNIKEESIVAKKFVRDHLLANNIDLASFEVPNKLVIACNTAHSRYKASLEEREKESAKSKEKEQKDLLEKELKVLEEKEKRLVKTCDSLEDDFTKYSFEAEKTSDLSLVVKGNALKRRQNELKIEVKALQDEIEQKRCKISMI